jgi:hypothetical protein
LLSSLFEELFLKKMQMMGQNTKKEQTPIASQDPSNIMGGQSNTSFLWEWGADFLLHGLIQMLGEELVLKK